MEPHQLFFKSTTKIVIMIVLGYLLGVTFLYQTIYNKNIDPTLWFRPPRG